MPFDEEELDPHGECAHEIATLRAELEKAKARTRIEKELRSQAEEEKVWLEAVLAAVAALQDEYDGPHTYCHECGGLTPCETRRAVHGGK